MPEDLGLTTDVADQLTISAGHLNVFTMKLPVFWPESCETWFMHAESQFHLKNITVSQTKFHHVNAALPQKEIDNVVDIVKNLPAANLYGTLPPSLPFHNPRKSLVSRGFLEWLTFTRNFS